MKLLEEKFINNKLGFVLNVYEHEGKEWFLAKEVSDLLGYNQAKDMLRISDFTDGHICRHNVPRSNGAPYEMVFMDELVLYDVCSKINRSDIERFNKVKAFQEWVFGEVLPKIRKNGAYIHVEVGDTVDDIATKTNLALSEAIEELQYKNAIIADMERELEEEKTRSMSDCMLEPIIADLKADLDYQKIKYNQLAEDYDNIKKVLLYYAANEVNDMRSRNGLPEVKPENKAEFFREFERVKSKKSIFDIFPMDKILLALNN